VDVFVNFVQRCRRTGITVTIIPGVMLIQVTESFMSCLGVQLFKKLLVALEPEGFALS
jgi:5,10-methylenetetrahydrofolate reductase